MIVNRIISGDLTNGPWILKKQQYRTSNDNTVGSMNGSTSRRYFTPATNSLTLNYFSNRFLLQLQDLYNLNQRRMYDDTPSWEDLQKLKNYQDASQFMLYANPIINKGLDFLNLYYTNQLNTQQENILTNILPHTLSSATPEFQTAIDNVKSQVGNIEKFDLNTGTLKFKDPNLPVKIDLSDEMPKVDFSVKPNLDEHLNQTTADAVQKQILQQAVTQQQSTALKNQILLNGTGALGSVLSSTGGQIGGVAGNLMNYGGQAINVGSQSVKFGNNSKLQFNGSGLATGLTSMGTGILAQGLMQSDNSVARAGGLAVGSLGGQVVGQMASNLATKGVGLFDGVGNAIGLGAKANATKNFLGIGNGVTNLAGTAVSLADTALFGNKTPAEYSGKKGGITQGMDMAYDAILAGIGFVPGIGTAVSALMAGNKFLGHALKSIGGGTDGMTTADAILGSSLFGGTLGAINGFGGSTTTAYTKDLDIYDHIGGSYAGTNALTDNVSPYAGKKFGLVSQGAKNKWEKKILEAIRQEQLMRSIDNESQRSFALLQTMTGVDDIANQNKLAGGYDNYMTFAKHGAILDKMFGDKLDKAHRIVIKTSKTIIIEPTEEIEEAKVVEEPKKPTKVQMSIIPEGALHARLHHMDDDENITKKGIPVVDIYGDQQAEIERNEIIFCLDATKKLEEYWRNGSDESAVKAGKLLVEEILEHTVDRTGLIDTLKKGGTIETPVEEPVVKEPVEEEKTLPSFLLQLDNGEIVRNYNNRDKKTKKSERLWLRENTWFKDRYKWNHQTDSYMPNDMYWDFIDKDSLDGGDDIEEFKLGGSVNVIPEGALHAHKNNMEGAGEDFTRKGIPVIDTNGEQLAEIELNEIIFRLEVTKRLEDMYDSYKHYDTSKSEKDEFALKAGKLLVDEILNNTDDRTGLIQNV